jgi:hypothetical protein
MAQKRFDLDRTHILRMAFAVKESEMDRRAGWV